MDERANGLVSKREPQRAHATGSERSVLRRASDFASPHFGTPVFPREFVGCSVPVLSAQKPWFSQGFAHFWPIALEFCSAHATRCMADRGVVFRVAHPKSSRFSSRASRQITGVLHIPGLAPIHTRGGGRIRTSGEMF